MAIPFKVVGAGQVAAKNVFRIHFSQALSAIPELHAWDNFNLSTVAHKIFTGTTVNENKPMIGAIGLSAAPSAAWWPAAAVAGAAVNAASRLIGNDGYCLLSAAAPLADSAVFFNLDYRFPADALPGDDFSAALSVTYKFTGDVPSVTWAANDGGTEELPVWTALTSQPKGSNGATSFIRPRGAGDANVVIPPSGEIHPAEIWVKAA
jgi:hypothetical protein